MKQLQISNPIKIDCNIRDQFNLENVFERCAKVDYDISTVWNFLDKIC